MIVAAADNVPSIRCVTFVPVVLRRFGVCAGVRGDVNERDKST